MAWVRFNRDFDYEPTLLKRRVTIAYRSGMELCVRRECADLAAAAGAADLLPTPPRRTETLHAVADADSG